MDIGLLVVTKFVVGVGMGALLTGVRYRGELRRVARFLRDRPAESNARVTAGGAPGVTDLADAINAELDRGAQAHVEALRGQQQFQRDLSALSHDIRTPLTGAKGYLQLACDEADPAARARHLEAATKRIDATTELLDQLFAYTKSTDPDLTLNIEAGALKPFVEEILLGQYPAFEARGWEPTVAFEDAFVTVEADREALARILTNLVVNAVRHGAAAPRIEERTVGGRVLLSISNTVADPAAIDATRLFDRFYQGDTSRGAKGSGLGLSVAANLAHAQDMDITAALDGDTLVITLAMR